MTTKRLAINKADMAHYGTGVDIVVRAGLYELRLEEVDVISEGCVEVPVGSLRLYIPVAPILEAARTLVDKLAQKHQVDSFYHTEFVALRDALPASATKPTVDELVALVRTYHDHKEWQDGCPICAILDRVGES